MKRPHILLTLVCCFFGSALGQAMYLRVETEKVPTHRLIANLEKQIQNKSNDVNLVYALARVHSMAYALNDPSFNVRTNGQPFFGQGSGADLRLPQPPKTPGPTNNPAARQHLQKAIEGYRAAVAMDKNHLPSQLGLAWCLDQSGDQAGALRSYRQALLLAWEKEKNLPGLEMGAGATEEVARYLLDLLDPIKDADEIKKIEGYKAAMEKKGRWITPILIPLEANLSLGELVDPAAAVAFDLDGSGLQRPWGWITPKAGWLVFDRNGRDPITSGLQMVGGVTFWVFWKNGYDALAALDNDADGVLEGSELDGLAIWQDKNTNGVSDPGEIRSLAECGIKALSCAHQPHPAGFPFNPEGVRLKDGSSRPSFDWIVRSRPGQDFREGLRERRD